jgi:hypothetical protein
MTSRIILLTFSLLPFFMIPGNAQVPAQVPDNPARAIELGCRSADVKPLASFLEDWHREQGPVAQGVLRKKPAFERAVYAIYLKFFVPVSSSRTAGYVIVQNSIAIDLGEADTSTMFRDTKARDRAMNGAISRILIQDFRPPVDAKGKKVLYMEDRRLDVLLRFLTGKDVSILQSYWEEPNGARKELGHPDGPLRNYRLEYLNQALDILPGHSGRGWQFETHPYVGRIYLHTDFQSAIVFFREGYSGGSALMREDKAGWRVVEKRLTWEE